MATAIAKIAYGTSTSVTITLASLASSSTRLAGRESTVVANDTNKYIDVVAGGKIMTGSSPTADKRIEVWVYGSVDGVIYPDTLTGSNSDRTITSDDIKRMALRLGASIATDNTSGRSYSYGPFSIAELFGGVLPKRYGFFVTHDTGVALNATGSNSFVYQTPIYYTAEQ
jgi:hypothetical protein